MNIEIRADGAHISGYVNVTEKKSRPVITPHGKVIEEVEPRAFEQALSRAGNINVTVDHDNTHVYASTDEGTLKLYEDNIGLHADVLITDETLIGLAKKGKIRGWSFGMYNVQDELEQRAVKLLHSKTGACIARAVFGEPDEGFWAIFWHTTAKADMTTLEKILYVADYMEPNRDFEGVERLRELAYRDLDQALLLGIETTIQEMRDRKLPVHKNTIQAQTWLREHGVTIED